MPPTKVTPLTLSARPGRRVSARVAGYTLIEMVVLMGLLGLVMAFAVSRLNSLAWRLDVAATQVAQRARVARTVAVLRQHDVIVTFDIDGRSIVVHEDADSDGDVDEGERVLRQGLEGGTSYTLGEAPAYETYEPGPVTFAGNRVTFHRNGSASQEGAVYVGTKNVDRRVRAVLITRATGYTQILRYNGSGWVRP